MAVGLDFVRSERSTLGVEWELALVDSETGELVPDANKILSVVQQGHPGGEHPTIKQEMLTNMVEVITGICRTPAEARADLEASIAEVRSVTDPAGIELMCAGTHPFSHWSKQQVTESARYAELINRTQWWGRHMVIFGVHTHVGIDHRDKVLPIMNALMHFFPHLQALSASSPYWDGTDTSYASNRAMMFQQLPTAGLPYAFGSWGELEKYTDDMLHTGVIDQFNEVRWDIRPAPSLGTIEVRVCDGMPTIKEVIALSAFVQCLVDDLSQRLDDGETFPAMPPWFNVENKWRAARYGMDAIIIHNARGDERLVTEDLAATLERLQPVAARLGSTPELEDLWSIVDVGASYQRQRRVADANGGDLRAVVASLTAEMRADQPLAGPPTSSQ